MSDAYKPNETEAEDRLDVFREKRAFDPLGLGGAAYAPWKSGPRPPPRPIERTVLEELRHRRVMTGAKITRLKDELQAAEIEFERCGVAIDALRADEPPIAPEAHPGSGHGEIEWDALPEGFTRWSSDPHADRGPQPSGDMLVIGWMGGDDFVGPIPAKDFNWDHDTDPVLGYKIVTSGDAQSPPPPSAEREVSNAFPGSVEGSREHSPSPPIEPASSPHAEGYAPVVGENVTLCTEWTPLSSIAPNVPGPVSGFDVETRYSDEHGEWVYRHAPIAPTPDPLSISASETHAAESDAVKADLPPLFPPEPPKAATVEELAEAGIINGDAYWLSRKIAKEMA